MRLIYLSPVPWVSFAQRPHKFVEWFHARCGGEVLWIDPYPTRLPLWKDLRRSKVGSIGVRKVTPGWLKTVQPKALPVEPLPGSGFFNGWLWRDILAMADQFRGGEETLIVIGKPSELAQQMLSRMPGVPAIYDAMDDFPAFYTGVAQAAMARRERYIASQVSRVLVSSTALADRFSVHRHKLALIPNACETESLPSVQSLISLNAESGVVTSPTGGRNSSNPVLGYVGTIGHWFDWPLVIALAKANLAMRIRLIGPVYSPPICPLPNNIELLPACEHTAAIRAMQDFSVGLIPFKCTLLTASVDPIKYYEYRALGLPVISTRFGEMALRERQRGVFLIDQKVDLSASVNVALSYRPDKNEIQQFRTENSWEARFGTSRILP